MSNPYDPYPGQQPQQQPADAAAPTQFVPIGGQSVPQPGYGAPQDSYGGQSQPQPQAPYGGYPQPGQPGQFGQPGQPGQFGQPGQPGQPGQFGQPGQPGQPPYGAPQQPQQPQAPGWGTAPQQPGVQQPGMPGYGAGQPFGGYPVAPQKPTRGTGARIAAGIFGTIIGRVVILALVAGGFAIYHFATDHPAHRNSNGQVSQAGTLTVEDLKIGDCFNSPTSDSNIESVTAIPCTEPHDSQIYAEPKISESSYPGTDTLKTEGENACNSKSAGASLSADVPTDADVEWFYPMNQDTFDSGTNFFTCALVSSSKNLTKSYVTGH